MADTSVALAPEPADQPKAGDREASDIAPRKRLGLGFWLSTVWLVVTVVLCFLAPWLPFVSEPTAPGFLNPSEAGPSLDHWFGTNRNGDDVFSQVVWGGRVSLMIGGSVVLIGLATGGVIGMTSGYFKGKLDRVISASVDVMLAFPGIIIALAMISVFAAGEGGTVNPSMTVVIGSLSILSVAPLARITRSITLAVSELEFVTAARTMGAKHRRILRREVLPNVLPTMAVFSLTVIAVVLVAEGALAFLGLSVSAPAPTWGKLILAGRNLDILRNSTHVAFFPAAALSLTVLALNYIGDVLQARFSVREGAL